MHLSKCTISGQATTRCEMPPRNTQACSAAFTAARSCRKAASVPGSTSNKTSPSCIFTAPLWNTSILPICGHSANLKKACTTNNSSSPEARVARTIQQLQVLLNSIKTIQVIRQPLSTGGKAKSHREGYLTAPF